MAKAGTTPPVRSGLLGLLVLLALAVVSCVGIGGVTAGDSGMQFSDSVGWEAADPRVVETVDHKLLRTSQASPPLEDPLSNRTDTARIVDIYPNPPMYNNRGEFVTIAFPPDSRLESYSLRDEHRSYDLGRMDTNAANASAERLVDTLADTEDRIITFSSDVDALARLTDRTLAPLDTVRPAADGDRIRLFRNGTKVDELAYERAPEGQVLTRGTGQWDPLGSTDRPVITAGDSTAEVFALPDEPDRATAFLAEADRRILLAGYTLSSQRVVDALIDARARGVTVEVLVDGQPVGGFTDDGVAALDTLSRAGIDVHVQTGKHSRYNFHHAKYAVVDDEALVTTENWKPAGTGGQSSRGWAAITDAEPIVDGLVETFRADVDWVDTISWADHDPTVVTDEPANGSFDGEFDAETVDVERMELLVAPDTVEAELIERIHDAEESIVVKQVQIGDQQFPLLQALIEAAERGVDVRILLASVWYVEDENRQLKQWLDEQARRGDLPLSTRLADGGQAFEKIHAKGLVIDGEQTVVGSVNWNNHSVRTNREVALVFESEAVGAYFEAVFDADWERDGDEDSELPVGLGLAVLAGVIILILAATQITFESPVCREHEESGVLADRQSVRQVGRAEERQGESPSAPRMGTEHRRRRDGSVKPSREPERMKRDG